MKTLLKTFTLLTIATLARCQLEQFVGPQDDGQQNGRFLIPLLASLFGRQQGPVVPNGGQQNGRFLIPFLTSLFGRQQNAVIQNSGVPGGQNTIQQNQFRPRPAYYAPAPKSASILNQYYGQPGAGGMPQNAITQNARSWLSDIFGGIFG